MAKRLCLMAYFSNFAAENMKRILLVAAAILAAVSVKAQKFPVGVVSVQDTVKSVQEKRLIKLRILS